jgi:type 1 glutamine amidotransferase
MNIRTLFSLLKVLLLSCFALLPRLCQAAAENLAPIRALYVTGGGYHDYKTLNPVLTSSITKYARVEFTILNDLNGLKNPDFARDYDVVVYNMCYKCDGDFDMLPIENAKKAITDGKPALMVHCAMHCFRKGDEWSECCGLLTKHHDGRRSFSTKKALPMHPIANDFPDHWSTPGDELYQNIRFPETSTPVLTAYSVQSKTDHVVAWVQALGKGRVFGTTLGHDLQTCGDEHYHRLLASGLLWACGKLDAQGKPAPGFAGQESK